MSERSSTSSRPREMRLSVERRLSDTSLREDSPRSPSFSRNGFLSPTRENFEDVDLGASVPLPVSPITSPIPIDEIPRPRSRLLTRSPSPSPDQRANTPAQSNEQDPTPIRRPSSALSNLSQTSQAPDQLQLASSSGLSSPTHTPSPPPRFINFKPALPSATIALDGHVDGVDPTAPFENISLTSTPPLPPLPASPTIVGSPESTRGSWKSPKNGTSGQQSFASSSSVHLPSSPRPSGSQNGDPESRNGSMTGESPQPRLHAPPAHPHPFPLPNTLSPSVENKGAKDQSTIPQKGQPSVPAALGVKGTSTFEKVISHTRPSWLPPKDKTEDEIHYHQWEDMMSQAREQEKERKKQAEIRRLEREKRMTANMSRWEDLMRTGFSSEKVQTDPSLRQLWFEGVPSHLRGKAWSLAVGNPLAMSKDAYRSYLARAKRSMETERFPADILEQLERDMDGTLPTLRLYVRGSPMRDDLREFICAWVVYRSDEGLGYAPYITHLAAMFLLNAPPAQAFLSLVNLLARPCMRAFYTDTIDEIDAYYRVFENLQADLFPKIFANCKNLGLKLPESYFRSMFIEQVPFETCCRLWDQIILDGDGYIFRAALAIFGFLEPRLHYPDKDEIASVLEGRNKATQAIVERERARAKLKGEAYIEALDGTLSVFGLSEEPLFDWLADDGWKESRFERLVTRELPD